MNFRLRPAYFSPDLITKALLALNALVLAYAACRSLFFQWDVTAPEGAVVYSVQGLVTGAWPLYRDYTVPPYSTTPYTPLFYLASAALGLVTTKSVFALYACCRILTLAATLGAAFFVRKIFLLIAQDERADGLMAYLLPFTILILVAWGYSARPDMLAVMFSLAGLYAYLRTPESFTSLWRSGLLLALAWWCKQSFVAVPAGIFAALLLERRWKRAGMFSCVWLAALVLLACLTQELSYGRFFNNIVTANVTSLNVAQIIQYSREGYLHLAPFITGAALVAFIFYCKPVFRLPKSRCVALCLLASVILNMAACMKQGAYFNYMLEPLFLASILAAFALQRLLSYRSFAWSAPVLMLAALLFSYYCAWHGDGSLETALTADIVSENAKTHSLIDKIDSFKEDVLIAQAGLAVRVDKPVLALDLFNMRYMEDAGKLSTDLLAGRIERGEIAAIVMPETCEPLNDDCNYWPARMRGAILAHYAPRETLYHNEFWYPLGPKLSTH